VRGALDNCRVRRDPNTVMRFVRMVCRQQSVDFVLLSEAEGYTHALESIDGYTLLSIPGPRGAADTVILVRVGLQLEAVARHRMTWIRWRTRDGGLHAPRYATTAVLGGWLRVGSMHRPPHPDAGWLSRAAARQFARRVIRLANRTYPRRPLVWGGDWQEANRASSTPGSPQRIVSRIGAVTCSDGGIDWAMGRGVIFGPMRTLGMGGSDHHMRVFDVHSAATGPL